MGGTGGATTTTSGEGGEGGALVVPGEEFLATSVAVAYDAACAITPSGEVACWGQGALGTGAERQYFPERVPGLTGIVAIRSGWDTVCALSEAGTLACWGNGSYGQLGNDRSGDGYSEDEPVAVVELDEVVDFALSSAACAVRTDGSVWCWGNNGSDQLGFTSEACGPYALETDTVEYFEQNCQERPRQVPRIEGAVQVSVGGDHQCALLADDSVVCWGGDDTWGELGRGEIGGGDTSPRSPAPVTGLGEVRKVAAGDNFTCALSVAGEVLCWGANDQGTLGRGLGWLDLSSDATPGPIVGLEEVADIEVHKNTACAITDGGDVYCWGQTDYLLAEGDKPDETSSVELAPVVIPYVSDVVQVSTQFLVACALRASSEVVCWGSSEYGATGNGRIDGYVDYSGLPVVWEP